MIPEIDFFPQRPASHPSIYAYEYIGVASHQGYIKVGYTERDVETRVKEQNSQGRVPYRILGSWSAMKNDGTCFTDHDVHDVLKRRGRLQLNAGEDRNEWFRCTLQDVEAAIVAIRTGRENYEARTQTFPMRQEQRDAVDKTIAYFRSVYDTDSHRTPKFLWNAKMRFGKTFTAYQLAKRMRMKRVLILTFKPAVQTAWREDLMTHVDFSRAGSSSPGTPPTRRTPSTISMSGPTRRSPSSASAPSRTSWEWTRPPAASRLGTSGSTP